MSKTFEDILKENLTEAENSQQFDDAICTKM
jgi:hypothetical protein